MFFHMHRCSEEGLVCFKRQQCYHRGICDSKQITKINLISWSVFGWVELEIQSLATIVETSPKWRRRGGGNNTFIINYSVKPHQMRRKRSQDASTDLSELPVTLLNTNVRCCRMRSYLLFYEELGRQGGEWMKRAFTLAARGSWLVGWEKRLRSDSICYLPSCWVFSRMDANYSTVRKMAFFKLSIIHLNPLGQMPAQLKKTRHPGIRFLERNVNSTRERIRMLGSKWMRVFRHPKGQF